MLPAPLREDRGRVLHYQGEDRKPGRGGGSQLCGRVKPQMFSHHTQGRDSVAQPAEPRHQTPKCWGFFCGTQGEAFGHISAVEIPTVFPRSLLLLPSLCFFLCLY